MVTVQTKFYGVVRPMVGNARAQFILPDGASFRDLIQAWTKQYGANFARMLVGSDGELRSFARISLEGKEVRREDLDLPIPLGEGGAEVSVLVAAPDAGG